MERLTWRDEEGEALVNCNAMCSDWNTCNPYACKQKTILNKLAAYEDAEEQGLLVKVECRCKDCKNWADKVAGCTEHIKLCTVGGYMVGENGYCVYGEQALKQMGE